MRLRSFIAHHRDRLGPLLAWGAAVLCAVFLIVTDASEQVAHEDRLLRAAMMEKPATGQVVIVEIDAKSLQRLDQWPWPRGYYADVTNKISVGGAEQIVFDIDFSSISSAAEDQRLADALARSEVPVVLPTFKQRESSSGTKVSENLPIPLLRENVLLGSVNVQTDRRGQLNHYQFGIVTDGKVRPSLASMMAGSAGTIGESFRIDQSIDPASIPRISFVDIITGEADATQLKGKKILIGATAIELGDRYAIGRHGVLPGVVIQALAAETLLQGTNFADFGTWPTFLFAAGLVLIRLLKSATNPSWHIYGIFLAVGLYCTAFAGEYLHLLTFNILPAIAFLGAFLALNRAAKAAADLRKSRYFSTFSNLPNETSLHRKLANLSQPVIAVAKLVDFGDLLVITDNDSRTELFGSLADRLRFLAANEKIYHLDTDSLGWIVKEEHVDDLDDHFGTAAALLQAPFIVGDSKVRVSAVFGASVEFLDKAKTAASQAQAAKDRWRLHSHDADQQIEMKQSLLVDLDAAIEDGDIRAVYQPKWDMARDCLSGAEALVRWQHPERGNIGPDMFVPILEKAGRIDELTLHILHAALADFSRWSRAGTTLGCAVNLSAVLLKDKIFIDRAIAAVNAADIPNEFVTFEVTETAALDDMDMSILALEHIREAGIKVSVDDYGTGQSTMTYLQRLPITEIKIDQSFIRTMTTSDINRLMVQSTIELAHALSLSVVAEGIEDSETMALLVASGCDIGQGWHISKPLEFDAFAANWVETPSQARMQA